MSVPALDWAATPEPDRLRLSPLTKLLRTESELATVVVPLVGLSASILKTLLFMSKVILPLIM